jgi:hypothetical protein
MTTGHRDDAVSQGVSETQVLETVLGERDSTVTGDRMADLMTALDVLNRQHDAFLLHRRIVLHGIYGEVKQQGQVTDIWGEVARILGHPRSTVNRWSHPPGIRKEGDAPDQEIYD